MNSFDIIVNMIGNIAFDKNVPDDERLEAIRIFNHAYNDDMDDSMPWGYVYRSMYADGHTYIGKRKIYPHTDWIHYVGSGVNLNPEKVVRKEFICFGLTNEETHELECKYIQEEINNASSRDMVLNKRINVIDSSNVNVSKSCDEIMETYGYMLLDLYLAKGNEQETADYIGVSRKTLHKFLKYINVNEPHRLTIYDINKNFDNSKRKNNKRKIKRIKISHKNMHINMSYKENNMVISHYVHDNKNVFIIICKRCSKIFETDSYDRKICNECSASNKISDDSLANIMNLIEEGNSFRKIGKIYNVSVTTVINFLNNHNVSIESKDVRSISRDEHKRSMHIRWHVRRDKPNMEDCEYCQRNEGFNDADIMESKNKIRHCMNPYCENTFLRNREGYCSDECYKVMLPYSRMFSAHMQHHVSNGIISKYCWLCENAINDSESYDSIDRKSMVIGCNEIVRKRNNDIIGLHDSGKNISEISRETKVAHCIIKKILDNEKQA